MRQLHGSWYREVTKEKKGVLMTYRRLRVGNQAYTYKGWEITGVPSQGRLCRGGSRGGEKGDLTD